MELLNKVKNMTLNVKKIQFIILALVVLLAGYFGVREFLFNKPNILESQMADSFFNFKVVRTDLTNEQIESYRQEFNSDIEEINKTVDRFNFGAFNNMAMIKQILHDYEGARDIWQYVGEKRPVNSLSFYNLGLLYANDLKSNELAEKNLLQALKNAEGEAGNEQYYLGIADFYTYNYPEKIAELEKILLAALESEPYKESQTILTLLATYYQNQGQKQKALDYWQRVLKIDPNSEAVKAAIKSLK